MFRHTADMGQISGMGGRYERACQDMLEAGCVWLETNKSAKLKSHSYSNVFGLLVADSDDAKAMEAAVLAACDDCTGAMYHAVMSRLFYIAKHGWQTYCDEMRLRTKATQKKT
jgi:hypothetical protein